MITQETGPGALAGAEAAGFGPRFVAYLVDALILFVPELVLQVVLGQVFGGLLSIVGAAAYAVYFWTSSGATPGKMLMGLRVVSAETGELVDAGTAVLRYVGYFVSGIPLGLGFLWIIWDENKQGWHDKIAKTRVVRAR